MQGARGGRLGLDGRGEERGSDDERGEGARAMPRRSGAERVRITV
ncbi:hypothetical protein OH786_37415 (plasmid) [Streptomyces atratus]|nr:hypothetical protein [Streptomyces atratus]